MTNENMKKKIIIVAVIAASLLVSAYIFLITDAPPSPGPQPGKSTQAVGALQPQVGSRTDAIDFKPIRKAKQEAEKQQRQVIAEDIPEEDGMEPEEKPYYPKTTEEIKQQIYSLGIETVEDLDLLDEVVQTGDADTSNLWSANWLSVDDWKGEDNGFRLEPQEDGTFKFFPDEETTRTYSFFETPKTYTYDKVNKEFYWEMDYYGKTIIHKARFINENVLVTMLISGDKVVLDIYEKNPDEEPEKDPEEKREKNPGGEKDVEQHLPESL
jgi:hypothetical protein